MTRQAPETDAALWSRLQGVFDDTPRINEIETPQGRRGWSRPPANPTGTFGNDVPDVMAIVVHFTGGWPTRAKTADFRDRFIVVNHDEWGIGPHFFIPYDGTVFRLLSETLKCSHAGYVNKQSIGIETG